MRLKLRDAAHANTAVPASALGHRPRRCAPEWNVTRKQIKHTNQTVSPWRVNLQHRITSARSRHHEVVCFRVYVDPIVAALCNTTSGASCHSSLHKIEFDAGE